MSEVGREQAWTGSRSPAGSSAEGLVQLGEGRGRGRTSSSGCVPGTWHWGGARRREGYCAAAGPPILLLRAGALFCSAGSKLLQEFPGKNSGIRPVCLAGVCPPAAPGLGSDLRLASQGTVCSKEGRGALSETGGSPGTGTEAVERLCQRGGRTRTQLPIPNPCFPLLPSHGFIVTPGCLPQAVPVQSLSGR